MSELAPHPPRPSPTGAVGNDLKSYTAAKHSLAAAIRLLQEFMTQRGNESRAQECHDLMVKLAEDRFTLAVVGQFNRGKSSLMNAILGQELLPVGILPLTSVITILRYGPRQRLVIHREGFAFDSEAPLSDLTDYVTEKGNPGNEKNIRAVYIELPSPFLRRGLEFVDTPGIGSAIEANTRTTLSFIPQCDAVLFVTSVDSPLSDAERDFLQTIRQHVRKIFFLVNKIDLLPGEDQQQIIAFVRKTLSEQMLGQAVKVFPVSARLAMSHSTPQTNFSLLSGLSLFKAELVEFLRTQKAQTLLHAVLDKAKRLFDAESQSLEAEIRMTSLPQDQREERVAEIHRQYEAMRRQASEKLAAESALIMEKFTSIFESALADFLRREGDDLSDDLAQANLAAVPHGRTNQVITISSKQICEKFKNDFQVWAQQQTEIFNAQFRERVQHICRRTLANAQSLARMISNALDLEKCPNTFDETMPEIALEVPELPAVTWNSYTPALRRYLPAWLSRRWIRRHLAAGRAGLLEDMRVLILTGFRTNLHQAFADLSRWSISELEKRRDEYFKPPQKSPSPNPVSAAPASLPIQLAERDRLRERMELLESEITGVAEPLPSDEELIEEWSAVEPPLINPGSESQDDSLHRALETRGCPVCAHVREALFRFYARWQYALASDEHTQEQFAADTGFCPLHTWQLAAVSSPDGMSLGFPKLVDHIAADLQNQNVPQPSLRCAVCKLFAETEQAYTGRLARALEDKNSQMSYAQSQGVCLRHLKLLIARVSSSQLREFLLANASAHFAGLAEDMRNYAIKREATRRQLANADENDAYLRTLVHLVGERYLCVAWNPDSEL